MRELIISDYSEVEVKGGAEKVDSVLLKELNADFCKSSLFTSGDGYDKIILSNYWELNPIGREWLLNNKFTLINHDYAIFPNRIPQENVSLVNVDLHDAAELVIFQSTFQENIFKSVISLKNTYTLGGSLWSTREFELFAAAPEKKNGKFAIPAGSSLSKGAQQAVDLANYLKIPFAIIPKMDYADFVIELGRFSGTILTPLIIESLGRQACEAKMLGLHVLTNPNMACAYEEWYDWPRFKIIEEMQNKKQELIEILKK